MYVNFTLTFNLPEKNVSNGTLPPRGQQLCKIILYPCINVQVMARTSSIYDHCDLYLTPVTYNLPAKMFQMALLLLKSNNYANYLTLMILTCNLPKQMFQMALLFEDNNCTKLF